ncbi:MAG TPA: CoA pyrophosphatase [Acidimicrobiales bacterium]|nr:CoA pyrophosphatase [Acidimicrobiales bacterium]
MTPISERPERFEGHRFPQVIPEPEEVRPGSPAPWAALASSQRSGLTLGVVESALRGAHRWLAINPPPDQPEELLIVADSRPAPITLRSAVLVALFEEEGETHVILTRRALSLRHHRGEIALPGGRSERDETAVATALREAKEEIGLDPQLVDAQAWLSPIASFATGSSIWPIVGFVAERPALRVDPGEVERVFTVTLKELVAEGAFVEERWRRAAPRVGADEEGFFPIYFFRVPDDVIWGATARVLTELLALVLGVARG